MKFMADYINRQNNDKGVYLFTGTPITNTLGEIYNMSKFFMNDVLTQAGIKDWDSWFNTFAQARTDVELTSTGDYEPITRLDAFLNTDELVRVMSEFTDVVQAKDMPEFKPRPTTEGRTPNAEGRPFKQVIPDVGEMSPLQKVIKDDIAARAAEFKAMTGRDKIAVMHTH